MGNSVLSHTVPAIWLTPPFHSCRGKSGTACRMLRSQVHLWYVIACVGATVFKRCRSYNDRSSATEYFSDTDWIVNRRCRMRRGEYWSSQSFHILKLVGSVHRRSDSAMVSSCSGQRQRFDHLQHPRSLLTQPLVPWRRYTYIRRCCQSWRPYLWPSRCWVSTQEGTKVPMLRSSL